MDKNLTEKRGIQNILRDAINYWALTFNIQIIFSVLYFSITFLLGYHFFKYFGLLPHFLEIVEMGKTNVPAMQKEIIEWAKDPGFINFVIALVLIKAVMFPLNIGLFHIYRKIDEKVQYSISDLYEGYRGLNFFKFLGFGVFWGFINLYAGAFKPLVLIWVLITIFAAPLMFFMNKTILESIRLTLKVLKIDFITIFICCILAAIFSYFGFVFFLIGGFFTFPFWNAVIYSMYQKYFNEVKNA